MAIACTRDKGGRRALPGPGLSPRSCRPIWRAVHWLPEFIRFASEATLFGLWGGAMLMLAALAFVGDRRRMRRRQIDAVGWMPWRDVAALSLFAGFVLLAVAVTGWLGAAA